MIRLRAALFLLLLASPAAAQQPAKDEALRHFRIGLELVDRSAWDSALAEFVRSRELYPTATAVRNSAVCLRELGRFDEALDAYDDLLAHLASELSPAERGQVDADMDRLRHFVGFLDITSEPPGATVRVDGRERGMTPLGHPLRVTVGTRTLRLDKEAFATFEAAVRVASGETTRETAKLVVVSRLGQLRVPVRPGFELLVDGAVVGMTPWAGTLTVGEHFVSVRNASDEGSVPQAIEIRATQTTTLDPNIAKLSGRLRVEPTPNDAAVFVDGTKVSQGSFNADVASGRHLVVVSAPWYETTTDAVHVSSRNAQAVRPVLLSLPRAYLDIAAGAVPAFDSTAHLNLGIGCAQPCAGLTATMRGGYNLSPHVALEIGILSFDLNEQASRSLTGYSAFAGGQVTTGYTETASVSMLIGAVGIRYQVFERTPLSFRLSAGMARMFASATSGGEYATGSTVNDFGHVPVSIGAWEPAIMPEVRFGYRVSSGLTFDVGIGFLLTNFPTLAPETAQIVPYGLDTTPARPSFGGIGWAIPVSAAFRLEL